MSRLDTYFSSLKWIIINIVLKPDSTDNILRPCHLNRYNLHHFCYCCIAFHVYVICNGLNHFPISGHLGCFQLFILVKHTVMNIFVYALWCTYLIIQYLGRIFNRVGAVPREYSR